MLRVLSRDRLPAIVVQALSQDEKWSHVYNVRIALIRQSATTLTTILSFLPELTISDLRELVAPGILPENLRHYLQAEIQRRFQKSKDKAGPDAEKPAARCPRSPSGCTRHPPASTRAPWRTASAI